jgi:capsular exopolysaccharide synthesis family protein
LGLYQSSRRKSDKLMRKNKEETKQIRVSVTDGRSAASEAYRTLRTNIQFMTLDSLTKSILVVGAHPGCGKTTTVTNLGLTLAQAGSSVLLVDTDLRRPKLHNIFNCKNFYGLTTMLIEEDLNMSAARHKTHVPNLDVIPSGPVPPNPAELLASRKMRKALKEFQNRYDYIILDSPPMMNMADASILAQLSDATIMVVAYAETTREELVKAQKQLQMAKANLIGVVLNGIPPHQDSYGYYGYYQEEPVEKKAKKKISIRKNKKKDYEEDDFDLGFDPEESYSDF